MIFRPIAITDREWMEPILRRSGQRGSEFTFSNSFNWSKIYDIQVAKAGERVLIRSQKGQVSYLFPVGTGDLAPAMQTLTEDAKNLGAPLRLNGVSAASKAELEAVFPGRFDFLETRDNWDYLYEREKLVTLAGKKLHSKRNHINRFLETNRWSYEPITLQNIQGCREMNAQWCEIMGCEQSSSLREEACAVKSALAHFEELGLVGGLLRVEGRVVAFTLGSPVSEDTMVVHIEKAFPDIQGAYPMINQQFVTQACEGYLYINREDDVGDEGLRKAKLSYRPVAMVEKFTAMEREG